MKNLYVWDPFSHGPNMVIDPQNRSKCRRKPAKKSTDGARGSMGFRTGRHLFSFCFSENTPWGSHCAVGICLRNAAMHLSEYEHLLGHTEASWGWDIPSRSLVHGGELLGTYPQISGVSIPKQIDMVLDFQSREVSFMVGSTNLGVAFSDLPDVTEVFPAVGLVFGRTEVTISHVQLPSTPTSSSLGLETLLQPKKRDGENREGDGGRGGDGEDVGMSACEAPVPLTTRPHTPKPAEERNTGLEERDKTETGSESEESRDVTRLSSAPPSHLTSMRTSTTMLDTDDYARKPREPLVPLSGDLEYAPYLATLPTDPLPREDVETAEVNNCWGKLSANLMFKGVGGLHAMKEWDAGNSADVAVSRRSYTRGRHVWSLVLADPLLVEDIYVVGVATREGVERMLEARAVSEMGEWPSLVGGCRGTWGWNIQDRALYHDQRCVARYPQPSRSFDVQLQNRLRVTLDCEQRRLSFGVQDDRYQRHRDFGVAFSELPQQELYLVFGFVSGRSLVSLLYREGPREIAMSRTCTVL